jgi:uncharacterized protein
MLLSLLLFVGTLALSLWATLRIKAAYAKYSRLPTASGYSGVEAAEQILQAAGVYDVQVVEHDALLGDHYDPLSKRLVLSRDTFYGRSAAALGIAAHECGHAIQHKLAYAPLQWRMAAVGLTNFASQLVMWLPLVGMITGLLSTHTGLAILAAGWGIIMAFNLITLPVEFDASRRAKQLLASMGFIQPGKEARAVAKVLDAAAWTYVAAFLTSLAYFLWHLLPLLAGGKRSEE